MIKYTNATELLEQGRTKDAYAAFLEIVELSTQQLHGVKFVHQTIVSKPIDYENSIQLLKSSVDQLQKIAILPGANINNSPVLKKSPPPLPPKPPKVTPKPAIPPRPKPATTTNPSLAIDTRVNNTTTKNRSRGNSVSFAKELDIVKVNPYDQVKDLLLNRHQEDDDDDDIEIEFNVSDKQQTQTRPKSYIKTDFTEILMETIIDPSRLVLAQISERESLTSLPTTGNQKDEYRPIIPAPPLLTTHNNLQQQLKELATSSPDAMKSEKYIVGKELLEKVRLFYMNAMTLPDILQFRPSLIAYQLTLIESAIFKNIPKHALLSHSPRTPHKKIVASTDFFNYITRFIEHSILFPQEAAGRAEIINCWIKVATKLSILHNYQTLKAVVSALGTPPIQRLRRTWDCIPKKRTARLETLTTLMSESDNYQKYREHVKATAGLIGTQPFVPFFGVLIHDITYVSSASANKEALVQDILNTMELYQRAPDYPQQPPAAYAMPKKNLTDALHFGSKKNNLQPPTIEYEQQMITQFVLMRPWVSEQTIDSLSLVREPAKPRSISSPTTSRFSMDNSTSSSTDGSPTLYSSSPVNHNSMSTRHEDYMTEKRSLVGGFWPFRKSTDMSRTSINTSTTEIDHMIWNNEQVEQSFKNRPSRSLSLPPPKEFDVA